MGKYKYTEPKLTGKPDSYVVHISIDGVQYKKRVSKKFTHKEQKIYAETLQKKWVELLKKDINPFSNDDKKIHYKIDEKITFSEAYKEFQDDFIGNKGTLKSYRYKLNLIDGKYGDYSLENITTFDLENLIKDKIRSKAYNQATVNQAKKSFNIFFNWCVNRGYLQENPSMKMGKLISDIDSKERFNPFEESDFKMIMDRLRQEPNPALYYNVNFIYHACIRSGEIQNLKVKDIDLRNNVIKIRASVSKNNTAGIVPIYPALLDIIKKMEIEGKDPEYYIFSRDSKNPKKPIVGQFKHRDDFFGDWFREVLKDLDLYEDKGYSIYCFKHTSNVHKADTWKPSELQKLNRHSSIEQTLTYLAKIRKVTEISHLESRSI
ncbi:site-specific integrase [Sphingobacterium sp.]|uniref:tyrosine-type recombinase/integrase n=1 Tax=Sphingobacterium sp. TaxID=341027 RepID=UPI0028A5C6A4|nr:site-specific integrase [Sphingobacterium sp.]